MRVVCIYLHQEGSLQGLAEVFYRATPQLMVRGERALFLEISKCRALYSEAAFLKKTRLTLRRLGVEARVAVADDISTALSFAFFKMDDKNRLPVEALRFYADPMDENLEESSKIRDMIAALRRLGVQTLLECSRLSLREVSSRFGSLGMTAFFRVLGQCPVVWRPFAPSTTVVEREEFDLENPVDNLQPILFRMKAVLDRVHLRLRGRGRRARQLEIVLRQEHALREEERDYKVSVLLQLPYISVKTIFQVMREKLEAETRVRPFQHRIAEFSVRVVEDVPYFMNQKDLFDQKKEENDESFFELVSRLATRLGRDRVFFAQPHESYLPEKSWARVPELKKDDGFIDRLPERPLRIFPQPIKIQIEGQRVVTPDFQDEIEKLENQEVVFSYWWEGHVERIYYKFATCAGRHLWVFRDRGEHYLHGVFD